MVKVFSTKGMDVPSRGSHFRVGKWVGKCFIRTPWFVVMTRVKDTLLGEVTRVR